jgi:glycine/D-amino acid oxidase-like deaminating enzyme
MMATVPHPNIKLQGNILTGLTIRRYESFKSLPSYAQLDKNEVNPFAVENGIHILFKQRIDGSIVIGDSHHYADSSNTDDLGFDVDQRVGEVILSEAQKIIHLPDWKLSQSWNGFYAQMKGEEEIFEHSPSENVHIVTAIGGKGMTASAGYALANCQQIFG